MQVVQDKVVSIHYTLTDKNGELLDSSEGQDPLAYIHGRGNIISGLENALSGKSPGDSR
jgi:FKBP-type peptidyl-prolyl cis-trans isomerase SlyD